MTFRVSHLAVADILNIADFLSTSSSNAALRFLDEFETTCARIKRFPRIGHSHAWLNDADALVVEIPPWMLIYRVSEDAIDVLRVVHGSADLPTLGLHRLRRQAFQRLDYRRRIHTR